MPSIEILELMALARRVVSQAAISSGRDPCHQVEIERALVQIILSAFPFEDSSSCPCQGATKQQESVSNIETAEWPIAIQIAEKHGLASLAYASLKQRDRLDELPIEIGERLRLSCLRTSLANWLAAEGMVSLLDLFEREGIPVILLKGSALRAMLYDDAARRPSTDLDLLIPRAAAPRVEALLAGHGFAPLLELSEGFGRRFANAQTFTRAGSRPAQIDVHWNLLDVPYWCERIDIEWFWRRTVEVGIDGRSARVFSPEAQLLHLSAHLAAHRDTPRLIWSYDLALLLARYGEQMNWEEVLEAASKFGLRAALKIGLASASDQWGVCPPTAVSVRVDAIHPGVVERILLSSVAAPDSGLAILAYGLGVPGLWRKLAFCWRKTFPSVAFMRRRYGIGSGWLLPLYYLWRLATGVYKPIRFAISLLRPRVEDKR